MRAYLDTSAAAKLLQREEESVAMQRFADRGDVELVGMLLVETELRRFATRNAISQTAVSEVLDGIGLFAFEDSDFTSAGLLPGQALRSLYALHVQGALSLGSDCLVSYDARMVEACGSVGLRVEQPGALPRA
ncbi:MAG: type II toxin-antitoxin system VapC family toxin [Micrococcales bacterium]|nr:type II toxin-antitoxin system VapC family toxin [Micrococcales bacterium]